MQLEIVVPDTPGRQSHSCGALSRQLQVAISHGINMGEELDWCNILRLWHTDKTHTDKTSRGYLTKRCCGLDVHG